MQPMQPMQPTAVALFSQLWPLTICSIIIAKPAVWHIDSSWAADARDRMPLLRIPRSQFEALNCHVTVWPRSKFSFLLEKKIVYKIHLYTFSLSRSLFYLWIITNIDIFVLILCRFQRSECSGYRRAEAAANGGPVGGSVERFQRPPKQQ